MRSRRRSGSGNTVRLVDNRATSASSGLLFDFFENTLINGKLDGLCGGASAKIVHSGLQAFLPSIEMHAGQLSERWGLEMDIETLTLANEWSTVGSKVEHFLLADLPYGFVDRFDVIGNVGDILNRSVVCDNHILHVVIPKSEVYEFTKKPWADDLEFAGEDSTGVNIAVQTSVEWPWKGGSATYLV